MALIDSQTAFEKRCEELCPGLPAKMEAQNIKSFSTLAFSLGSPQNPVSETDLSQLADAIFDGQATLGLTAVVRWLHFEACTLLISDMKTQTANVDATEPLRKLPFIEKQSRLDAQKRRITGLLHSSEQQPAHALIDLVFNMVESGSITYIPPSKCHSREHEIQADAKVRAKSLITIEHGTLKTIQSSNLTDVDTGTELRLYFALLRRNLAFELVNLISWTLCQTWLDKLMTSLVSESHAHFQAISLVQILRADRELFSVLASEHKGSLKAPSGGKPPLDELFERLMYDPRINVHLISMPKQQHPASSLKRPADKSKDHGSPPKKPRGPGLSKAAPQLPEELKGLNTRTADQKPLCWHFNMSKGCNNSVRQGRCRFGMHHCMKCLKPNHGASKCREWLAHGSSPPKSSDQSICAADSTEDDEMFSPQQVVSPSPFHEQLLDGSLTPVELASSPKGTRHEGVGIVLEIFAGTCRLSKACNKLGLNVVAVDKDPQRSENFPVACFDISKGDDCKALQQYITDERLRIVHSHFAPSCGTASRARERPLRGERNPPKPLRSDDQPDGLDDLSEIDQRRVNEANQSYQAMVILASLLLSLGISISIENPINSIFWLTSFMRNFFWTFPQWASHIFPSLHAWRWSW